MTVTCPKCGKEIANKGALRMHEAHCKGTQNGAPEGAGQGAGAAPGKGETTVKPPDSDTSTDQGGNSGAKGFWQSIEDDLNA